MQTPRHAILSLTLVSILVSSAPARDEKKDNPPPEKSDPVVLVDSNGKEQKLSSYKITTGIRHLGWLGTSNNNNTPPAKGKRPAVTTDGPPALVIRDDMTINFADGVLSLIPLTRLRAVRFDTEKALMHVVAVTSEKKEDDVTLSGSSKYKSINKLTLEAEVDKGDEGVAAFTYQGGIPKGGFRELRFASPKPQPYKPTRVAGIVSMDDGVLRTHKVSEIQALYRLPSGKEVLLPTLMFKKTLKLDLAKIKSVEATASKEGEMMWEIVRKDNGETSTLTLLGTLPIDKQNATLVGLIAEIPVGYKLFPLRRIKTILFDTTEIPKSKITDDDD